MLPLLSNKGKGQPCSNLQREWTDTVKFFRSIIVDLAARSWWGVGVGIWLLVSKFLCSCMLHWVEYGQLGKRLNFLISFSFVWNMENTSLRGEQSCSSSYVCLLLSCTFLCLFCLFISVIYLHITSEEKDCLYYIRTRVCFAQYLACAWERPKGPIKHAVNTSRIFLLYCLSCGPSSSMSLSMLSEHMQTFCNHDVTRNNCI